MESSSDEERKMNGHNQDEEETSKKKKGGFITMPFIIGIITQLPSLNYNFLFWVLHCYFEIE